MDSEPSSTRERLVVAMTECLRRGGYGGTSMKQLTAAAQVTVGSLYHHFPGGKLDLASEALRQSGAAYGRLLPMLLDEHADLETAVASTFDAAAEQIETAGWINMCPVGTVAGEVADSEPELRAVTAEVVAAWIHGGTAYFAVRGLDRADARELTLAMLSALEGAFILSRTLRSAEPIRAAGRAMADRVHGLRARTAVAAQPITASPPSTVDHPTCSPSSSAAQAIPNTGCTN